MSSQHRRWKKVWGRSYACAGMAAHLAGVIATTPYLLGDRRAHLRQALGGLTRCLSTVQMPSGIPVATVAVRWRQERSIPCDEILALASRILRSSPRSAARMKAAVAPGKRNR
jgi:5-(carboxyamino)imidazole ribonucleotide mutase